MVLLSAVTVANIPADVARQPSFLTLLSLLALPTAWLRTGWSLPPLQRTLRYKGLPAVPSNESGLENKFVHYFIVPGRGKGGTRALLASQLLAVLATSRSRAVHQRHLVSSNTRRNPRGNDIPAISRVWSLELEL